MNVAILGSGMAGLGAAYHLRHAGIQPVIYEMKPHYGGHTTSRVDPSGFVFDEGPHISFTKDARVRDLFAANVSGEYEVIHARVNNYWKGSWIKHPAQCNIYGLPTDLAVKILLGIVEAHHRDPGPIANYEDWLVASYGRPFAETFPMQYGRKYHTTDASNMSTDWLGPRLYRPSLEEVFAGALSPVTSEVHYITDFRYPRRGGFMSFLRPFANASDIRLNHKVTRLDTKTRTLTFSNGATARYDQLVSSIPLPELLAVITDAPDDVRAAAGRLACSTCVIVTLGIDRADISEWHWTYFYDDDFCFSRISFPSMFSKENAPPGTGSIQAELYFSKKYKPLETAPESLVDRTIQDLRRCGLIRDTDRVLFRNVLVAPYANIIFDLERSAALRIVHGFLDDAGILYCGRYGEWGYQWTDEAFMSGERAAQQALDATTASA